jgi:hypothetical protein
MQARSFVTEKLLPNSELREEQSMATKRCGDQVEISAATRLTFFASLPESGSWRDVNELPEDHLLGYAVIVTLRLPNNQLRTFLLEAVTRGHIVSIKPVEHVFIFEVPKSYIHNLRIHKTCLGTSSDNRTLKISGTFFTQQNDLTSVCAHAALRMAVNSSHFLQKKLEKKIGGDKLTNKHINDILKLDFSGPKKSVGHYKGDSIDGERKVGLKAYEIEKVIVELGARLSIINFIEDSRVEYDGVLYPVTESGYPAILEIQGWDIMNREDFAHALAVAGHTLNTDRWEPEAKYGYGNYPIRPYIPVSEWVCHYIMSDDNYGMDVALPSAMVRNDIVPVKNPKLHVTRVLSILPKAVHLTGHRAESFAMKIASQLITKTKIAKPKSYWLEKLKKRHEHNGLVCRTILLTAKQYRSYIKEITKRELLRPTEDQLERLKRLPRYIWVTEISIPNLYTGNKTKLGDVLINASSEIDEDDFFVLGWFPGFARFGLDSDNEHWYVRSHVPLIAMQAKPLSW